MPHTPAKLAVAHTALAHLQQRHQQLGRPLNLGIGTGTTVNAFIDLLAESELYRDGGIDDCVASSNASGARLEACGLKVARLNQLLELDSYLDGADRVAANGCMIKGGGGAMFGEKLVAQLAGEFVCMAEETRLVSQLGDFPVAIEVVEKARSYVARQLVALGGQPELRQGFTTDQGHVVIDLHNINLTDPTAVEDAINAICGVLDNGIFAHTRASLIVLGKGDAARQLRP